MDNQNYENKKIVVVCGGNFDGATITITSAAHATFVSSKLEQDGYKRTSRERATYHFVEVEIWEKQS